ncbi:MAG: DUF6062 family protein [Sphaerochaetaceae bacterium]|jgi:hypothetical protein|nr:DUF6062 family protein [Sphaerochaetaceae bacterium]
MKYELETIPVWDALQSGDECLLCNLMKSSEQDALSYYLGSSVMHPQTRVAVNKTGFCPTHWKALIEKGSPQSLALIAHTYLQETRQALKHTFAGLGAIKEGRRIDQVVRNITQAHENREQHCLVCTQMEKRLKRYAFTIVHLWEKESEFRHSFEHGKGVCLHHMGTLMNMAQEVLAKMQAKAFIVSLVHTVEVNLQRLEEEVLWMTQKYKAENSDKDWNGCEDAQKRTILKLVGEGRLVDPL